MPVLDIRQFPDPVLKRKSEPVGEITRDIRELVRDMIETMYAAPGVGLAAPQVGVSLRLAVIDVNQEDDGRDPIVLVNPEVVTKEGELEEEEGCLSVKGHNAPVRRFARVRVRAQDLDGNTFEIEGDGLLARALQHEVDHLDGMLFLDHVSPLRRDLIKRKLKKGLKKEDAEDS